MSEIRIDLGPVIRAVDHVDDKLKVMNSNINAIQGTVDDLDNNVQIIYDEVGKLANEFHEFIAKQFRANRLGIANTKIVQIRQELDKKYGHYDTVRRHTTGILQAADLEIIRSSTITTISEELMLDAPNYWLAPCLVALAAWINDQPDLADKALHEAIKRDDEKTSLLFTLICRRADRKGACLKWTQRYLANQDEENLDRKAVVILDAFASGLLGADSEGVVGRQMSEWMDRLSQKTGFVEHQTKQWSDAINLKRQPMSGIEYPYLKKYSKTWAILKNVMEGARLHETIFDYFEKIFKQESSNESLKSQLDEIMTTLVTEFDNEELPLRKEEKFEQFVIDFEGDEGRAKSSMLIEQSAFETHKDFTQLLTDAAMKPESSHASVSTQKFAIALSRDWIDNAYNDVIAKNRMNVPSGIAINIENFNGFTKDGSNENELVEQCNQLISKEKETAINQIKLTAFEQFCLWGSIGVGVIGMFALIFNQAFLGLLALAGGIGMFINYFSKKRTVEMKWQNLENQFEKKRERCIQIVRATLAEVVDFRVEFQRKDNESQMVTDFLEQISPDQYVKKLSDSTRRIKIAQ